MCYIFYQVENKTIFIQDKFEEGFINQAPSGQLCFRKTLPRLAHRVRIDKVSGPGNTSLSCANICFCSGKTFNYGFLNRHTLSVIVYSNIHMILVKFYNCGCEFIDRAVFSNSIPKQYYTEMGNPSHAFQSHYY